MSDLTLYTHPFSRGRLGRMLVEETGRDYDAVVLDWDTTMKAPDYLALNPMGKVPTLVHGDTVVTECAAIAAYVADAFPDLDLAPDRSDPARGAYYRWLFFMAGPFEAGITDRSLGIEATPEVQKSAGYGSAERVLDTLETVLKRSDWLAGDRVSMADIYVAAQLRYTMMIRAVEERPVFRRYADRLAERPAFQRAAEKDDALAKQMV